MIKNISPQKYDELSLRMQNVISNNMSKIVVSVIIMTVFTLITSMLTVIPAFALTSAESAGASLVALFLSIAAMVITVMLSYGLCVMLGRFYCHEKAVIGHLLWGFRDASRLIGLTVVGYLMIFLIILIVAFMVTAFGLLEVLDIMAFFLVSTIPVLIVVAVIVFPWLLVFPVMYHNPKNCSLKWCLSQSSILLRGNKKQLFVFLLRSCWRPAVVYIVLLAASFWTITDGSALSTVFSNISSIFRYVVLVKVLLSLNAFYYFITETGPDAPAASPDTADTLALEVPPCESATDTPAQN